MASPPTRPEAPEAEDSPEPPPEPEPIAPGPTAVQDWLARGSFWASLKMRKLALASSLPASPRPVVGTGFWKVSDQPLNVPVPLVVVVFWMTSVHVPLAFIPAKVLASD